jgi:hypothetical protein
MEKCNMMAESRNSGKTKEECSTDKDLLHCIGNSEDLDTTIFSSIIVL